MNDTHTPTLTIHTRGKCDKEIIVTGENLHMRVDFDDVDHVAVARELGLAVDACNAHGALVAEQAQIVRELDWAGVAAVRVREGGGPENVAASVGATIVKLVSRISSQDRQRDALVAALDRVERELRRAKTTGLHPYQVREIHEWIVDARKAAEVKP